MNNVGPISRRWIIISATALLTACGSEASSSGSSSATDFEGSFSVEVSSGGGFTQATSRARIEHIEHDLVGLKADRWHLRIEPRIFSEEPVESTSEFNRANTFIHMPFEIDGNIQRIGCDPTNPVQGRFDRTDLSDTHMSGSFSFTVHSCRHFYTDEDLELPGLPWTVTGHFEGLPLSEPGA